MTDAARGSASADFGPLATHSIGGECISTGALFQQDPSDDTGPLIDGRIQSTPPWTPLVAAAACREFDTDLFIVLGLTVICRTEPRHTTQCRRAIVCFERQRTYAVGCHASGSVNVVAGQSVLLFNDELVKLTCGEYANESVFFPMRQMTHNCPVLTTVFVADTRAVAGRL